MDLTIKREQYLDDGIFSRVTRDDTGEEVMVTCEHAYPSGLPEYTWLPKVMPGKYTCVRGTHQLAHGDPFETFEVTGVAGHSGILFHRGNWQDDSRGCLLCGEDFAQTEHDAERPGPEDMVTNSRVAFESFMALQAGADVFTLTVVA